MLRSVAIYHGIPLRQARLRRFYSSFASRGDVVFDIGAHAGNRSRALAALGCRVVAVEPQPDFVRLLQTLFGRSPHVEIVEAAVGAAPGRALLSVSHRHPTVTTMETAWRETRRGEPGFSQVRWDRQVDVSVTTLDALIERYGTPVFVKLDVEGAEPSVLAGLTSPIKTLSFEYLPSALDFAAQCVSRIGQLGTYRYNWSIGESYRLASDRWLTPAELMAALDTREAQRRAGDVYAKLAAG
ncbi:MAG: FkbM family methyltransferase [Vicinamibacterales bacterium]